LDFMNIPRGKHDKPILLLNGPEIAVDCNEIDGQLAMLDRAFSGCVTLGFSKEIDKAISGKITLDGRSISYFHHVIHFRGVMPVLAVYVFPYLDAYDHIYMLHIEGFTDTDGNVMLSRDVPIRTLPKPLANKEDSAHEALALQAAEEGFVLLKNEGDALPMKPGVLNIFGIGLHLFRDCAVGAGKTNARYTIGLKQAIRESHEFQLNENLADFYKAGDDVLPDEALLTEARVNSDTAIVVLTRFGGENTDGSTAKGEYYLSDGEDALLHMVMQRFNKTIVVLNTPGPIDTKFADTYKVDALIYMGFGGMLGGCALLNILSGKTNPSGKLTDTWALNYMDIPASKNFYDCAKDGPRYGADEEVWIDTVYEEDIYVGYRHFETFSVKPAYCFGHGLSYTRFSLEWSTPIFDSVKGLNVSVQVNNIGTCSGKEVTQVYISKPNGRLEQPARELIAFEKTKLLPCGEAQTLHFAVPIHHMASYDEHWAAYIMPAGTYRIYAGTSVANAEAIGCFTLKADLFTKLAKHHIHPVSPIQTLTQKDLKSSWPQGRLSGVKANAEGIEPPRANPVYTVDENTISTEDLLSFQDAIDDPNLIPAYVSNLSVDALCRLSVCANAAWNMAGNGVAGRLEVPENLDIPAFTIADGNSGIRVDPKGTGFPSTVVYGATFNKQLVYDIGVILGHEAMERGVDMVAAPGMNLHRNPLNGRNPEYFSEDPYLTGMMAAKLCAGIESVGVGACYKHILANNCETSRKRNQSIMTERALRELYFRAFELAFEAHMPISIMTSYNAVNGRHTAADTKLIRGLLRDECGFDGMVMTDWNTYDSCDPVEIILGGNNWLTPGSADDTFTKPLKEAVESGRLPLPVLKESVGWLLKAVARMKRAPMN
jgi:Beta-glucosidase-related glycosidases